MKRALCMAYSHSDESKVDEGKKTNVTAVKSAISPGLANAPAEPLQEDSPEVMHKDKLVGDQQEQVQITNPIEEDPRNAVDSSRDPHDPPQDLQQAHHDSHEGVQRDPLRHPQEPHREVIPDPHDDPLRMPREPRHEALHNPRDTFRHDPRDTLRDPRQPLRSHSHEPWYMHDAVRRHEVRHPCEDTSMIERDALHPHNAFYHPSQFPLYYEFTAQDGPPASELHHDAHYAHGEHERTYPSRYSPVLGPDYAYERGYPQRNDLDERRAFDGGGYRDSGYPQDRPRHQDSRRMDNGRNAPPLDYVRRDAVP
ncbi:hypothetical protein DFH29DRAFT_1003972 [Suillus ampliporus]|nr:hypothetical protein DFH29DRAFT_1003972 [Suillus ampliporus]